MGNNRTTNMGSQSTKTAAPAYDSQTFAKELPPKSDDLDKIEADPEQQQLAHKYPDVAALTPPGYVLYEDDETAGGKRVGRMRPCSTQDIAIIPFYRNQWTSAGHGINDKDLFIPPESLQALGLTVEIWARQMDELQRVQQMQMPKWKKATAIVCTLGFAALSKKVRGVDYQNALKDWQAEFNHDVLEPLGLHCKTQSHIHGFMFWNGQCMQYSEIVSSWFAIAVGSEAVAALKQQDHLLSSGIKRRTNRHNEKGYVV